jgi:ABC-type multidrug transport system ATPase subunit
VLRGADLSLRPGEVVGLVGENGSGKSTIMKILVGELGADAGTVTRTGVLGYCPQQPVVYERLTCDEHIELFARAYRMTHEAERRARRDLYEALGFERYAGTRADRLSGGTLAKLNLTLAMLADPPVLLLDEPYAGFDWDTYLKFWDLVARRRDAGRSVLIVSHFVTDEHRFDRIVRLCDVAALVSAVALIALAVRTNIDHPGRVIVGTLMFALIYLAIGALVGVVVSNPVNGA